jgi:hypothetical protein
VVTLEQGMLGGGQEPLGGELELLDGAAGLGL